LAFLALGFYLVYRRPKAAACAEGSYCARPASHRIVKLGLWSATLMVLLAMTFSYWLPLFIET
jgi:mercuric ion transport protein